MRALTKPQNNFLYPKEGAVAFGHILGEMGGREGLHKFVLEHNFRCSPDATRSKSAFCPASSFQMGVASHFQRATMI